jgi:uncharacterized SAM-binding protein YcdF (DUF218 family)
MIFGMSDFSFVLYKTMAQFIMPLGLFFIFMAIAAGFFLKRRSKAASWLFAISILWLWLWSSPVWSDFLKSSLESSYHYQAAEKYPAADAIVVLGGGIRGFAGASLPPIDLNRAADRELFTAQLYHCGKAGTILLSGGADPLYRTGSSALSMKIFLINLGVPARAIRLDAASRNTVENAREVVRMVRMMKGKRILLVTSALHMRRAMWLFSDSGLEVIPAPTDFEVVAIPFSLYRLAPDAEALENSSRAFREIIGLWIHRMGFH